MQTDSNETTDTFASFFLRVPAFLAQKLAALLAAVTQETCTNGRPRSGAEHQRHTTRQRSHWPAGRVETGRDAPIGAETPHFSNGPLVSVEDATFVWPQNTEMFLWFLLNVFLERENAPSLVKLFMALFVHFHVSINTFLLLVQINDKNV